MNPELEQLIDAWLDDRLSNSQVDELNRAIKTDPQFARAFAEASYLHDRLYDLSRTGNSTGSGRSGKGSDGLRQKKKLWPVPRQIRVWGVIAASLAILLFSSWWNASRPLSAATELDRLIAKVDAGSDRRYEIRNLDRTPEAKNDRQPPIDGATLYVRSPDHYVLIRNFPDGRRFLTGSDGRRNWAIPPDGAVRVSHDPERFRGPVPGHQHGLPFADVHSDLNAFRNSYDLSGPQSGPDGLRTIAGTRKSGVSRGPRSFEMKYEPISGSIRRMIFDGLPQARGGPRRVAVELIDSKPLPETFFRHEFHHEDDREVFEED